MDRTLLNQVLHHLAAVTAGNRWSRAGAFALGLHNWAGGKYASIPGGLWAKADKYGQRVQASGRFAAQGDAQASTFIVRGQTTDATTTTLFLDGAAERLTIADNTTWFFRVQVAARRVEAANESAAYEFVGCIDRQSGAATTALVGAVAKTVVAEDMAAWDGNVAADAVNGALAVTVNGQAGKTVRWVGLATVVEVGA